MGGLKGVLVEWWQQLLLDACRTLSPRWLGLLASGGKSGLACMS